MLSHLPNTFVSRQAGLDLHVFLVVSTKIALDRRICSVLYPVSSVPSAFRATIVTVKEDFLLSLFIDVLLHDFIYSIVKKV